MIRHVQENVAAQQQCVPGLQPVPVVGKVSAETIEHFSDPILPGQIDLHTAVAEVSDVGPRSGAVGAEQEDRKLRRTVHATGQAIIIIDGRRQTIVQEGQVKSGVQHGGGLPGQEAVDHLGVGETALDAAAHHIVDVGEGLLLLVPAYTAVVTQRTIGYAQLTAGEETIRQSLNEFFFCEFPACCHGREPAIPAALEELGGTVHPEVTFEQVFVIGGIIHTADVRAQSFRCGVTGSRLDVSEGSVDLTQTWVQTVVP